MLHSLAVKMIKLTIEYDGSGYHGWQRQPGLPTLQATLEDAVQSIAGHPVKLTAAGRTDAGVHARGQVANFCTQRSLSSHAWMRAVNRHLPADIVITRVEFAQRSFDARRQALEKLYEYEIVQLPYRPALLSRRAWHWPHPLSLARMRKAAQLLVGRHDFAGFQSADARRPADRSSTCHLIRCDLVSSPPHLTICTTADRFLYLMVRNIVGTLIEIGRGRWTHDRITEIFETGNRSLAGPPAPPHGLYLAHVVYRKPPGRRRHRP